MTEEQKAPWYSEEAGFFGENYLAEYTGMLTAERTRREVDFLESTLRLTSGTKILDCPCGHGRHSIELVRRGYRVTGQDLNGFFLDKARRDAREAGVSVRWHQGDMPKVPFREEFDVALNLFTAFGYLESDEEDQKALDAAARALRPGGKFVLDVRNRDWLVRNYCTRGWRESADGGFILEERSFDHVTGRNHVRRTRKFPGGAEEVLEFYIRFYSLAELVNMLRSAGLEFREVYGGYDGAKFGFSSQHCIVVAAKGEHRS